MTIAFDRRAFISSTGALVVALASADWSPALAHGEPPPRASLPPDQLDSYISIDKDGAITAYYGKIDGGQGLITAIPQMVAEELDVPLDRVHLVIGDTFRTVNMGGASAATGISRAGMNLRRVAAQARKLMVERAAENLGIVAERLSVTAGVIHDRTDTAKAISYAELIGGHAFDQAVGWNGQLGNGLALTTAVKLKEPQDFKVIGTSPPRRDLPGKVFGTLEMATDVRLPGMLHARMIRPKFAGAVPIAIDENSIVDIPGTSVVHIKDFLAVVAEKEWNAVRAAQKLKVTWSESKPNFPGTEGLHDYIRNAPVVKRAIQMQTGNFDEGIKQAARVIEGEYEYPTQSHSSMGPACGVADVRNGECTIYTSTQKPHYAADGVAELLGLPRDKVRAIWKFGTGSYGRNDQGDATADAAVLSQHIGRPVRVQYMRHEAIAWDPKGTASVNRNRAGLDASGTVIAYENISKAFSRLNVGTNEGRAADLLAGHLLGFPLRPEQSFEIPIASYNFAHQRRGWEIVPPLMDRASPMRTTHLRDPYGPPILFGSESFIDELAAATETDAVQFRLHYLSDPRDRDAVSTAAERFGWDTRPSPHAASKDPDYAIGRGIAFRRHFTTFVALAVKVVVHRKTGVIEPIRYVCAHDVGLIVNPDTLRQVIDRQLVYGTSRTFYEELKFDADRVTSVDWQTYPVLHADFPLPYIDIVLIKRPEEAPSGAAEMALGLVPAAIGNAVFDATGVRLRRIPFTPERVKAALEKA
jgi:nicotinate dehydrogenase subunit B